MSATPFLRGALLGLCLMILVGCSGGADLEGRYSAVADDTEVTLELGPAGKGVWTTADEEIAFTWERRGDQVWLHTKTGGLVAGTVGEGGAVTMDVPGVGAFNFTREGR